MSVSYLLLVGGALLLLAADLLLGPQTGCRHLLLRPHRHGLALLQNPVLELRQPFGLALLQGPGVFLVGAGLLFKVLRSQVCLFSGAPRLAGLPLGLPQLFPVGPVLCNFVIEFLPYFLGISPCSAYLCLKGIDLILQDLLLPPQPPSLCPRHTEIIQCLFGSDFLTVLRLPDLLLHEQQIFLVPLDLRLEGLGLVALPLGQLGLQGVPRTALFLQLLLALLQLRFDNLSAPPGSLQLALKLQLLFQVLLPELLPGVPGRVPLGQHRPPPVLPLVPRPLDLVARGPQLLPQALGRGPRPLQVPLQPRHLARQGEPLGGQRRPLGVVFRQRGLVGAAVQGGRLLPRGHLPPHLVQLGLQGGPASALLRRLPLQPPHHVLLVGLGEGGLQIVHPPAQRRRLRLGLVMQKLHFFAGIRSELAILCFYLLILSTHIVEHLPPLLNFIFSNALFCFKFFFQLLFDIHSQCIYVLRRGFLLKFFVFKHLAM
mmetsp:Transcript_37833/g.65649  ORF Transcript_37833/g.65649 Transcript_37833/m.65649 type:complete len:485 (+) Transcript_37833:432-1886(+)